MSSTIREIAGNTDSAQAVSLDSVAKADEASERVRALGLAAQQIGSVTSVVEEISEQTNLLALNTSIEAAR